MILGDWGRRAWYLLNRRRFERELAEEMAAHRDMLGEPRRFGNTLRIREEARDAWVARWLDEAWQDLRYAARSLVRAPLFALSVVLILSVGIGLNLAVFQLINVVALRPPAVRSPETLVLFHRVSNTFRSSGIPYPATQFIREHNTVLSATLTRRDGRVTWESDAASRPRASYVSANWFAELGYNAALGRAFVESIDERVESPAVVVVSDGFWRTRLQAASDAVGRNVRINDHPVTIIGVAPPGFPDLEFNPRQTELWLLLTQIDRCIPLIAGRNFQPDDDPGGVVIISRRLANEMYGTLSVLGKPFPTCAHCVQPRPGSEPARTIIGISEDASLLNPRATTVAEQYMPIDRDGYDNVLLLARAHGDPAQIVDPMRAAVRAADNRVIASTKLMRTSYEEKLRTRAFAGAGVGITGVLALTLACFGIFGVVSYGVATRTREIGIRRALGATGASVLTLVLQHLVIPVGVGMGLGVAAGLGAGWLLARDPLYLPSSDVLTPLLIVLFFAITAAAAAVWPASRALGVEPIRALRHE